MKSGSSNSSWLLVGTTFGFLSVAFGAFGAHALKAILEAKAIENYKLACLYMMFHALALIGLGLFERSQSTRLSFYSGVFFSTGTLLFSGSLIGYSLTDLKALVFLTPIGGLSLLVGWALFFFSILLKRS